MKRRRKIGSIQRKVLVLLLGGVALSFARSARQQFLIVKDAASQWKEIDRQNLRKAIKLLYRAKLVDERHNRDGTTTLILSDAGKKTALTFNIDEMHLTRPSRWDGKWRVVLSDIPETRKAVRDTLRYQLKRLGFQELQKSVYVVPFDCNKEIEFLTELHNVRKHLRFIVADSIDNELELKRAFKLD